MNLPGLEPNPFGVTTLLTEPTRPWTRFPIMRIAHHPDRPTIATLHADASINEESAIASIDEVETLVDRGVRHLSIECARLDHLSSFGLGMLIRLHHRLRRHRGNVTLMNLHGPAADAIRMTQLDRVFEIQPALTASSSR